MFKKAYRETVFMQSLATAAIMFSAAKACTDGKLQKCHCSDEVPPKRPDMKWGGCGDNTKKAKHITRRFMQVTHPNTKFRDVLNHSIEVGIKTVIENEKAHCYCPGGSKYNFDNSNIISFWSTFFLIEDKYKFFSSYLFLLIKLNI